MDGRLDITDAPRGGTSTQLAETPLLSVAWQLLQSHYKKLQEEHRRAADETDRLVRALASIARRSFKLERLQNANPAAVRELLDAVRGECAGCGFDMIGKDKESYRGEMMEVVHNVARKKLPNIEQPFIDELLEPAILYRGRLIAHGKAVIAIPDGRVE